MASETVTFPAPSAAALERSTALTLRIRAEIERLGGWIGFDRYMQMALYEPGLGYYSGGSEKIGAAGDFTTAPELGALVSQSIGVFFESAFSNFRAPVIFEIGAGTGAMALHLLRALAAHGRSDVSYRILETSADLRARQRIKLQGFSERVTWVDTLPNAPIEGLILANEVADALPVARFVKHQGAGRALGVTMTNSGFVWAIGGEDQRLSVAVNTLELELGVPLPDGYRSEICLMLSPWIATLSDAIGRGAVLLIDYGLPRREYYHAQRFDGTLICHYRHRAHGDPFLFPGLQDISAWVDFSACAAAAAGTGLAVASFTTQAQFLLATAASTSLFDLANSSPAEISAMKTLLLPGEMGERFKLLLLTRNLGACALLGRDFRNWL
jgi:SAM-dependent MidA family methyltransferase